MLSTRIVTAVVLIAIVLAALFLLPPRGFGLAALIVMLLAAHEWATLIRLRDQGWLVFIVGLILIGLYLLFGEASEFAQGWPARVVLAVCGVASLFWVSLGVAWVLLRWPTRPRWLLALIGWIVLIATFVALVQLQTRSPWLVLAAMATVWIADTAAYFTGRALGRHKLAPAVSPGKTWEGLYGALGGVFVYAMLLVPLAATAGYHGGTGTVPLIGWVAFMLAVTVVSVVGDLFESWLKRAAGVKDSSNLLPGHGGVLDRIDALLAAMPLLAIGSTLWLGSNP